MMKCTILVVFLALLSLACARLILPLPRVPRNYRPFPQSPDDEYAASLGGAPVGLYEKRRGSGRDARRGFYWDGSEAQGLSLGNAKVGLYGKENRDDLYPRYRG